MTPLPILSVSPSKEPHATSSSSDERPERSRNAKAQARHRAKRKAYIEQLEQTVVRLQHALQVPADQLAAIPPPVARVRELEEENIALHREIELLRRQLEAKNARLRPDIHGLRSYDAGDARSYDAEYGQRRAFTGKPELQAGSSSQLPSPTTLLAMPPLMQDYAHSPQSPSMTQGRPSPVSPAVPYGYAYQLPETPPSSSSTSSPSTPSFSPVDSYGHLAQRSAQHCHQTYTQGGVAHYGSVKVEEDSYPIAHDGSHSTQYANTMQVYGAGEPAMSSWGSYADRG